MNLTIRQMHSEDIPAGLQLCRLSRWNQLADDWRTFLDSPDGGGRLAEREGAAVGTVAYLRYGSAFSWLSMMLVDPEARRAGIGARLMEAALEALAGEACVRLDATPLGEPLYRRFGFRDEYGLVRTKVRLPASLRGPAPESVRPMSEAELPEVFARDRQVFGAGRSALLASFFRRAPELAWIARRGGALAGYCFGRPGHLYRQLGPVVAEDAEVARELVSCCLAVPGGGELALDAPCRAPGWIYWLESAGFTVERPFLRMCRGDRQWADLPGCQFAIAGPEFG